MLLRLACLLQLSCLGFTNALLPSSRDLRPAPSHAQQLFSPRSRLALGTGHRAACALEQRPRAGAGVLFSLNGGAAAISFEASANQPGWVRLLNKGSRITEEIDNCKIAVTLTNVLSVQYLVNQSRTLK